MPGLTLCQAADQRRSQREFSCAPVPRSAIDNLLKGIMCATNTAGNRSIPSAHGLYPLSMMVSNGNVSGLSQGLFRFDMATETLLQVSDQDVRPALETTAIGGQPWVGNAACIITICGNAGAATTHFLDQPPYGERGLRYLYLEAGAAAQMMLLHAVDLGLGAVLVAGFQDTATAAALDLPAQHIPIAHICLGIT